MVSLSIFSFSCHWTEGFNTVERIQRKVVFIQSSINGKSPGGHLEVLYSQRCLQFLERYTSRNVSKLYWRLSENLSSMLQSPRRHNNLKALLIFEKMIHVLKVNVLIIISQLQKVLTSPKLSLPQKSVSSLANRNIKNNCRRDMIESALEPPDNVLSNVLWFMLVRQIEKVYRKFL